MPTPMMLHGPADILSLVPFVLGFHPADSVVVLGIRDRRLVFQARGDLADAAHLAGHYAAVVGRQQVTAVIVIGYGPATSVTPVVLAMKQAGVDGFESGLLDNTNLALLTTARQAGLHLVAPILPAGFSQDLIDQPAANQAAQGAIYTVFQRPVNEPNAATRAEQAAFAKYEHFTGIPSIGWTEGWLAADLVIKGLQGSGSTPSRTTFLSTLHNLKGYTAEGLLPLPLDLSLADFGKAPAKECQYFAQLEGNKFNIINNGNPVCGNTLNG